MEDSDEEMESSEEEVVAPKAALKAVAKVKKPAIKKSTR